MFLKPFKELAARVLSGLNPFFLTLHIYPGPWALHSRCNVDEKSRISSNTFISLFHCQQDVVDEITTVKFVFISWVGENVKPMAKGKISTYKATIDKAFHVSFITCYHNAV